MPKSAYYLPSRKLVAQDDAAIVQKTNVPRSTFTNRFGRLTTFDAGQLIPFIVDEILPGDHMRYNVTAYARMATALFPIFSNQRLDTHFFFVPARILWDNWVKLQGQQDNPTDSIAFVTPYLDSPAGGFVVSSLADQFALPTVGQVTAGQQVRVNALPFRAYNRIWNAWFRDENIHNSVYQVTTDGPDAIANYTLLRRAKSHDYFTSALPWVQKFTPLQTLFTGTAPVIGLGVPAANIPGAGANYIDTTGASVAYPYVTQSQVGVVGVRFNANAAGTKPEIYADLSLATGVTINALRQAWLVQDLLERDARGGTRYVELIRSHFGVTSPDFRLQRPEYIGGGQTSINITPIAQTATGGGGLGALAGVGTAAGQHSASYAATEHGYIIGLISIKTQLHYQQGLHKMWSRSTRFDYYMPSLAGLGEQAVLRQEIYANGVDAEDTLVFGYQERWQEYRTRYNEITGLFRSTSAGNIDEWHLAEQFNPAPTLSSSFIEDQPPMTRVLAAGASANNQQYLCDIQIDRVATRPIPMFGTPATLARF